MMALDLEGMMWLWTDSAASGGVPVDAFRDFYTDPVTVNGAEVSLADLAQRAVALGATFADLRREILDVCDSGDQVAVAFRLTGRQKGVWATSAGDLPATGQELSLRVIDVLRLTDGRISEIWMVADELGALAAHGLVRLQAE